jgi:hypothetical protein
MTYLGVVKNTKIDFIVFHTISFRVVLFAQVSPIGSLAKKTATAVGMVNNYDQYHNV